MDNLALSVSKSITDFLQQNEKRFSEQHTQQELHNQLLIDLQAKVEQLETKCEALTTENKSLREELDTLKQREDATSKDMITTKSDLEKMHAKVNECSEWVRLITALTQQVHNLNESRDTTDKEIKTILKNQIKLDKQIERHQRQLDTTTAMAQAAAAAVATTTSSTNAPHYSIINRTPIRSPSASSFLNGNTGSHSSLANRYKPHSSSNLRHHYREDYAGSIDANDEISEMSENAESLLKEVQALNELHRSFERNSICSDDHQQDY